MPNINPAEDFSVFKVDRRNFSMDKVEFISMVDMVDNLIMVDSIDIANIQKTCGYLKLIVDTVTLGWTRRTWLVFWWTY